MSIVAVINQKGGVGKSTTAAALLSGLTLRGKKALAIDLDAQGNLSFSAGADRSRKTSLGLLTREVTAAEAIQDTPSGSLIPSSKDLTGADAFITGTGKEYRLREALEPVRGDYDYIILDTPPALGILTVNALTAADTTIIPAQADIFSIQGIEELRETIQAVKKYTNPRLTVNGILLTRYNSRSVLSREIAELAGEIAAKLESRVYRSTIREAIAIKEAQLSQQSIFDYAPKGKATEDYASFIAEFLSLQE